MRASITAVFTTGTLPDVASGLLSQAIVKSKRQIANQQLNHPPAKSQVFPIRIPSPPKQITVLHRILLSTYSNQFLHGIDSKKYVPIDPHGRQLCIEINQSSKPLDFGQWIIIVAIAILAHLEKMMRKLLPSLFFMIFVGFTLQKSQAAEKFQLLENSTDPVPILFVQNANEVNFGNGTMTLKGVSPSTTFFSDRPERIAGHLPTQKFLKIWDEGKDSFKNDPPNANLSILGEKEGATDLVLEISNPRMKGNDLSYDIKILDGVPPKKGGIASLFIDWFVIHGHGRRWYPPPPLRPIRPYYGPRVVCTRNWYTGRRWCHVAGRYY